MSDSEEPGSATIKPVTQLMAKEKTRSNSVCMDPNFLFEHISQKEENDNTDSEFSEAKSEGYFRGMRPPNLLTRLENMNLSQSVSNISDSDMSFDSVDHSSPVQLNAPPK